MTNSWEIKQSNKSANLLMAPHLKTIYQTNVTWEKILIYKYFDIFLLFRAVYLMGNIALSELEFLISPIYKFSFKKRFPSTMLWMSKWYHQPNKKEAECPATRAKICSFSLVSETCWRVGLLEEWEFYTEFDIKSVIVCESFPEPLLFEKLE